MLVFILPFCAFAQLRGEVLHVTDGDTVVLVIEGKRERVRLIGVDAPELHENPRAVKQAGWYGAPTTEVLKMGARARDELERLCPPGSVLRVDFDVERRDRYGRLLSYLVREDGVFINEEMLRGGYAMLFTVPPNVSRVDTFREAFRSARRSGRGLWNRRGR